VSSREKGPIEAQVGTVQALAEILFQLAEQPVLDGGDQLFFTADPA
jgi:hypothetical protein